MFGTSHKKVSKAEEKHQRQDSREERRKRREDLINLVIKSNRETATRLDGLESKTAELKNVVSKDHKELSPAVTPAPAAHVPRNLYVDSHNCKSTFGSLLQLIYSELRQDPETTYTADSVAAMVKSVYTWVAVDSNSVIQLPLEPGVTEVSTMYPEGSVVTRSKAKDLSPELAKAMELNCKVTDDTPDELATMVSGGRRGARSNASVSSVDRHEESSRARDLASARRAPRQRTVVPIPQYTENPGRSRDLPVESYHGVTGFPPESHYRQRRDSRIRPGSTLGGFRHDAPIPEHEVEHGFDDASRITSPALRPRNMEPPNVRVVPRGVRERTTSGARVVYDDTDDADDRIA